MISDKFELNFDKHAASLILKTNGRNRMVFDNFELNFRLAQISLKSGRITLFPCSKSNGIYEFSLSLKAMGSSKVLRMAEFNGSITASNISNCVLLSYHNDFGEINYSPDRAVCLCASELQGVSKMVLFHNRSNEFQNFDCEGLWWSQAAFLDLPAASDYYDWGMLLCLKFDDGRIGVLLPVTNDQVLGRIQWNGPQGLSVISCSSSSGLEINEFPIAIFTIGDSVNAAIESVLDAARKLYPNFTLSPKGEPLPTPFDKLGWCSWNAFGPDVTAGDIQTSVDKARDANLKLGYVLIDDGWLDIQTQKTDKALSEGITSSSVRSLECDRSKFPQGIKSLVDSLKQSGISHVGLWHTLNGYWNGLASENELVSSHPDWFVQTAGHAIVPSAQTGFYDEFYSRMKLWGINFVKIDNQGYHRRMLPYKLNLASYMASVQHRLKCALEKYSLPAIFCMATHPEVIFNTGTRRLLRISNDFVPNDAFGARRHVVNNFYNDFWLGKIAWSDYDMFQSNDMYAETFARMLALSNSPVYISDKPDQININLLKTLVLPTGAIPRYSKTARVLESTFFDNPYAPGNILAVSAEHNGVFTLGLFNTVESSTAVTGVLSLSELGLSRGNYLVYFDTNASSQIKSDTNQIAYSLKGLKSCLVHIASIANGFGIIGNIDYFASPAIVKSFDAGSKFVKISLKAPGRVLCYSENAPKSIHVNAYHFKRVETDPAPGQFCFNINNLILNAPDDSILIEY